MGCKGTAGIESDDELVLVVLVQVVWFSSKITNDDLLNRKVFAGRQVSFKLDEF